MRRVAIAIIGAGTTCTYAVERLANLVPQVAFDLRTRRLSVYGLSSR